MHEMRTATFVTHGEPGGEDLIEVATSGDEGQGERLIELIEAAGRVIFYIDVCDVSEVAPDCPFWDFGNLGPRPDIAA